MMPVADTIPRDGILVNTGRINHPQSVTNTTPRKIQLIEIIIREMSIENRRISTRTPEIYKITYYFL